MSGFLADSQQAVTAAVLQNLTGKTLTMSRVQFVVNPGSWPIFIDQEPDVPDNVITIYGTLGKDDGRTQIDGELQEHHGIQIRVRSLTKLGFKVATSLAVACDQLVDMGVQVSTPELGTNNYIVQSINRTGNGVLSLGKEMPPTRRNLYTINALINVRMVQ